MINGKFNTRRIRNSLAVLAATALSLISVGRVHAYAEVYSVDSAEDNGAPGTLRWAIIQSNNNPGTDRISVSGTLNVTLLSPLPPITDSVTIEGRGLSVNGSNTGRLMEILSGTVSLRVNLLSHGRAVGANGADSSSTNGGDGSAGLGGAILIRGGNVTIEYTTFEDNTALGGTGGSSDSAAGGNGGDGLGGAVYVEGGTLELRNCKFRRNRAERGAGGLGTVQGTDGVGKGGALAIGTGGSVVYRKVMFDINADANFASDAGNERTDNPEIFGDATLPFPGVAEIRRLDPINTKLKVVRYGVLFDAPVSGVNAADFVARSGGNIGSAAIQGVEGSGRAYTVSLDVREMENLVWLNFIDDDSVTSDYADDVYVGGAGPGNGSFIPGSSASEHSETIWAMYYQIDTIPPRLTWAKVQSPYEIDVSFDRKIVHSNDVELLALRRKFELSGAGRGSMNGVPDTVDYVGGPRQAYRLSWKSGQMADKGDLTIAVAGLFDWTGNEIDPMAHSVRLTAGGYDPTPPRLLVVIETEQQSAGIHEDIEFNIHLDNIGVDFAEETLLSIAHSENAEFVSLSLAKPATRSVSNVVVAGNSLSTELGAIDPSDNLLFTLKLRTLAEGPLVVSANAASMSIIGEAAGESPEVMVMESAEDGSGLGIGDTNDDEFNDRVTDPLDLLSTNYCGAAGILPLGLTAMLLFAGPRRRLMRRYR